MGMAGKDGVLLRCGGAGGGRRGWERGRCRALICACGVFLISFGGALCVRPSPLAAGNNARWQRRS